MSDGAFMDWLRTDSWGDYRQQRRLRMVEDQVAELGSSLAGQRDENRRLRTRVATLQGSIEQRMSRLTAAFEASIELSDVRAALVLFAAPALIRHRSRALLTALDQPQDTVSAPVLPPSGDVDGYWLAPAVRSAAALLRDASPGADLAAAQALDSRRTAVLIAALAALAGRRDLAGEWLPVALGELGGEVPRWQRLLWQEAAAGTFGDGGRAGLTVALRAFLDRIATVPGDALAAAVRARTGTRSAPAVGDPGPGSRDGGRAAAGGRRGPRLENHPAGGPGSRDGGRPAAGGRRVPMFENDPSVATAIRARGRLAELRALCAAPADPPGAGLAAIGALVRALVDEGTAEEKPLLRRAEELRATIEGRPPASIVDWDEPLGSPEDLLVADAFDRATGASGGVARHALADVLVARAAELAVEAAVDVPYEATVDLVRRTPARVTAAGVDRAASALARAAAEEVYPPVVVADRRTWALAAGGVAVPVLAALGGTAVVLIGAPVGAALLVAAGARAMAARRQRALHEVMRDRARQAVDDVVAQAVADFAAGGVALATLAAEAAADRDAIATALAG